MRDQIISGITAAMNESHNILGSDLHTLGEADQEILVRHILTALSVTPDGTPAPQVVDAPVSAPVLVLSPADVVARYATDALSDVRHIVGTGPLTNEVIIHERWAGGPDQRQTRELVFRIQSLFGCRARSTRTGGFLVAGTPAQIRAFQRVLMTLSDAAAPIVVGLSDAEQRTFYATLGTIIVEHEDAADLMTTNDALYRAATEVLSENFGRVRNLNRAEPATEGDLYAAALQIGARANISDPNA